MRSLSLALLLLAACGPVSNAPSVPVEPAPEATGPTYYQDVKPLLDARCGGCHVKGGIAPFALTTYEEAMVYTPLIKSATHEKRMPPWMPGPLTPPLRYENKLTEAQIATIGQWADA